MSFLYKLFNFWATGPDVPVCAVSDQFGSFELNK